MTPIGNGTQGPRTYLTMGSRMAQTCFLKSSRREYFSNSAPIAIFSYTIAFGQRGKKCRYETYAIVITGTYGDLSLTGVVACQLSKVSQVEPCRTGSLLSTPAAFLDLSLDDEGFFRVGKSSYTTWTCLQFVISDHSDKSQFHMQHMPFQIHFKCYVPAGFTPHSFNPHSILLCWFSRTSPKF